MAKICEPSDCWTASKNFGVLARACAPLKYTEYIEGCGMALFQRVCELDLEVVVAKQKSAPYVTEREHSTWFKILNREYSQKDGESNYLNVTDAANLVCDSMCGTGIVN